MTRIETLSPENATPKARALLEGVQKKLGMIPNLFKALANSPAALESYLSQSSILSEGALSPKLREQIALVTAGANGCEYCASAHIAIGKNLKLDENELRRNLDGVSNDPRTAAALSFVNAVVEKRGHVSDDDVHAVREAGFSDGEIAEIVAHISLNTLTNYFNSVAQTEIDFPRVALAAA